LGADAKQEIAAAAAALEASPADLGDWLDLATALSSAGRRDEAAVSFFELGKAASSLGQVALAVACARWLSQFERDADAKTLVAQISETHCAGSEHIDRSTRPRPPAPPRRAESPPEPKRPNKLEDAVKIAEVAVEAAIEATKQRAGDKLPPTPLLSVLDAVEIRQLVGVTKLARRKAGAVVVDLGQPASTLFWLARGTVSVTRDDEELGELRSGAFFGEIALLSGTTRTARVACVEECWLLEIPAKAVEDLASKAPHLATVLAEYARARLLANVMRTSELFQRLDDDERKLLLGRFESRLVHQGEAIVRQGEDNEELHVVVSGRCEVRDGDGLVANLTVGDGFGESSLLRRTPAAADVIAIENTVTLSLSRVKFDDIAVKHPELLAEVYKLLVERERQNQAITHDATDLII
jgi:CRP-like cAMP-binding protein